MTVDIVLRSFVAFLGASWGIVEDTLASTEGHEELANDWLQSNWEILVEAILLPGGSGFLEVYGEGADCNGASSRVFRPEALPTHAVRIVPSRGSELRDALTGAGFTVPEEGLLLDQFVAISREGRYYTGPPFDHLLADHEGEEKVVPIKEVDFVLGKPRDDIGV